MIRFKVLETEVGQRIDITAVGHIDGISRSFVHKLLDQGKITVNGQIKDASDKLHIGDKVAIDYDPIDLDQIPDIELPILYEDEDCLVIDKPIGVLTHSKGAFNPEATVATFALSRVSDMNGERAGIVHRLDRATSGVMIIAKNPAALAWLQKQFSQRKVKKTYAAVVNGVPEPAEAIIDMPIERNPKKPQTFRVGANGKSATTHYIVEKSGSKYSLIKLAPTTGRTHQLRVHLKKLGFPIVGDELYGGEVADRLYLHALSLEITLPNKGRKVFESPLPKEFMAIVETS
ncbi:MAG TPA: RluA family pseudouridine synthase [Candidatus Saccharimonadales bacterium]|nr:RluA family pseudouridine synthase [Candidatus Saccharimonadales bacterium]